MTAREEEFTARELLARQELIDIYLKERRWAEIAALLRYIQRDVPHDLATTDPALYRTLRAQITRFYINGGAAFSLPRVEALAAGKI